MRCVSVLGLVLVVTVGQAASGAMVEPRSFDLVVRLVTGPGDPAVALISGELEVLDASGSGYFALSSLEFADQTVSPPGWNEELNPAPTALNAANSFGSGQLGATADDLVNGVVVGHPTPIQFVTLAMTIDSAAIAEYDLKLVGMAFGNLDGDEVPVKNPAQCVARVSGSNLQPTYTIDIVLPEPASALLLAAGGLLLGRRRAA